MDPELLKLFVAAKGQNKNVSGLLNNIDNPILAYLAGVYDPVSAGGGNAGGPLWAQYANSQEPIIQDLVGQIQGGMDEFALNSYIDSLVNDEKTRPLVSSSGFQVGDLKGLAKALQKEYTGTASGSGGKQDVWSKAGLRNPLDLYSAEDAPLTPKESSAFAEYLSRASESEKGMGDIEYRIRSLQAQANRRGEDTYDGDMISQGKKTLAAGGGLGESVFKPSDMIAEGKKTTEQGDMIGRGKKALAPDDMISRAKSALAAGGGLGEAQSKVSGKKKTSKMSREQGDAISRAMAERHDLDTIIQGDLARAQSVRQGGLARAERTGRTPTRDQLAGIMQFLASQK